MKKEDRKAYAKLLQEAWRYSADEATGYMRRRVGKVAHLESGGLLQVDRCRTETRFCYGHDGDPAHEASAWEAAATVATDPETFIARNLRDIDSEIAALADPNREVHIVYNLAYPMIRFCALDWSGRNLNPQAAAVPATAADRETILEAYKAERAGFERRLRAYVKRYGLSHVTAWAYWRD